MPTLQESLVEFFKLPHKNFLHKTLLMYLGIEEWTDKSGNTITLYHDGSIRILKKEYAADMQLSVFLYKMEKDFDVLYDKRLYEIILQLQSLAGKLGEIAAKFPDNGYYECHATLMKHLLENQYQTLKATADTLNTIKNHNSADIIFKKN
jgi:hypothetical protein